jgi:peroxiredoxin/mono/diheme cytochrome c family protein
MMRSLLLIFLLSPPLYCHGMEPGERVEEFHLRDLQGRERALSELSGERLTVLLFLGVECPLANLYAPRLTELATEFESQGVRLVGIDSNRQDTPQEVSQYAARHHFPFPLLKDLNNVVADALGAERTPEAYVLDAAGTIRYRGRIDDQYRPGIAGARVQQRDLRAAIEALLQGADPPTARTTAPGCWIGRISKTPPAPTGEPVTWSRQIAPIFQAHCQECHRPGEIGPMSFLSYPEVQGWEAMIAEVVAEGRMPPWHASPEHGEFVNDIRLSSAERELIAEWVRQGAPEGDPAEAPPPQAFPQGWTIPNPDQIVYMSDKPFVVPAEGSIEYQYFEVDPGFTEDHWLRAMECRPGSRSVVHHINVFLVLPEMIGRYTRESLTNYLLWAYSPGLRGLVYEPGVARHVPAGSRLVFQMHYSPSGAVQEDRSCMALWFAKQEEVRYALDIALAVNNNFIIPPGAPDTEVVSWYEFAGDAELVALHPHMHLRGRSFCFHALYPNGQREVLLEIPNFDFNWQYDYRLQKPKPMPRGTRICCVAHYDNSADNRVNPDPAAIVRWGDQTWQEMMIGYLHVARPRDPSALSAAPAAAERAATYWLPLALAVIVIGAAYGWFRTRSKTVARVASAMPRSTHV